MSDNFIDRPEGILWFESAAVRDHFKPAGLTEIRDLCAGSSSLRRTLSEFGTRLIVLYWVQQREGGWSPTSEKRRFRVPAHCVIVWIEVMWFER